MGERGFVLAVGRYRRDPQSVALARRNAVQAYAAYPWIDGSLVALLVSEVVTNAVLHADGSHFYVLCHSPSPVDGSVQVEVHDRSSSLPHRRQATDQDENGRGLALLDLLAARWRTERTASGKTLVFTLEGDKCRA
jgi:anti-sigma regulatory factor (Ser/Thr protein kinase)